MGIRFVLVPASASLSIPATILMLINLGNADTAMYQAKRQGNSYQFYSADLNANLQETDLRKWIARCSGRTATALSAPSRSPQRTHHWCGGSIALAKPLPVDLSLQNLSQLQKKVVWRSDWGMGFVHCLRSKSGLAGRWIAPLKWQSSQPSAKSSGNGRPSAQGNKARCHLFRTRVDREPG